MVQEKAQVLLNRRIAPDHFRMQLKSLRGARHARPGQFIHVLCPSGVGRPDGKASLLRRPFSLFDVDPGRGTLDLIYKVVGVGTSALAQVRAGDRVDFLGPLGRPFWVSSGIRQAWLIGGGVGIPPLYFLAKWIKKARPVSSVNVSAFLGARTKDWVICVELFRRLGIKVCVATDDGTRGYQGSVVSLLKKFFRDTGNGTQETALYVCGPTPMMAAAWAWAAERGLSTQVSLEERMGCAMGCCMGCVVEMKKKPVDSHARFQRVCTEGPVFPAEAIAWR